MNDTHSVHAYTLADATGEILIMLLVAFALGALLGRLLSPGAYTARTNTPAVRAPLQIPAAQNTIQLNGVIKDDLTAIDGITSKTESVLNGAGIRTLDDLAHTSPNRLRVIIGNSRENIQADPDPWPMQAANFINDLAAREQSLS